MSQQDSPKSKAKSRSKPKAAPGKHGPGAMPPVEEQLTRLAMCGIRFARGACTADVFARATREQMEASPYEALLRALGGEGLGRAAKPLTDQVFYLECDRVQDDGDYVHVLNQLARLAGEALPMTVLRDHVDVENEEVWVDVELDGLTHRLTATADDGWLDMTIVGEIALWLERRSQYGLYLYALGQDCLVICIKRRMLPRLMRASKMSFARLSALATSDAAATRKTRATVAPKPSTPRAAAPARAAATRRAPAAPSTRETRDVSQPALARATERERLGDLSLDDDDNGGCAPELALLAALGRSGETVRAEVVGVGPHGCDVLLEGMTLTYCLLPPENMRADKRQAILDRWRERLSVRVATVIGHGLRPALVVEVSSEAT